MIEARGLVKRYGPMTAVDHLRLDVRPGTVTGFLGPNGAGKSTTMRMILGLDAPTAGKVTVNGRPYTRFRRPLREIGALAQPGCFCASRRGKAGSQAGWRWSLRCGKARTNSGESSRM